MNARPAPNPYLKTKILTATPEELRLMLYEGALRFCRQAREALEKRDFENSYEGIMRAQKIVLELSTSLNHSIAPELCEKLSSLYTYIYRRLVDANLERTIEPLDEAIRLLDFERETWGLLMKKLTDEGGLPRRAPGTPASPGSAPNLQQTQQTAISSLSIRG